MSGFEAEEGDRTRRLDRRAENLAGAPVDAARQVDRDHRQARAVHRGNGLGGNPLDRPVEAGAEQSVDNEIGTADETDGEALAAAGPRRRGKGGIALEPVAGGEQADSDLIAGLGHQAGRDEAVAAIVARSGHHQNAAALGQQVVDRLRHGQPGRFHQRDPGSPGLDGQRVGLAHLLRGKHLDRIGDQGHRAGNLLLLRFFPGHQAFELRGPLYVN